MNFSIKLLQIYYTQFEINKKKKPEALARSLWISQKIYFITFKSYIPKQFFYQRKVFLNQSMTSVWPPKIVQILMCHPV